MRAIQSPCKSQLLQLLFFYTSWLSGMFTGCIAAYCTVRNFTGFYNLSLPSDVSFIAMIISLLGPYLLTAVVLRYGNTWYLYLLVLFKSFLYFFSSFNIMFAYGDAAWLVKALLMFSSTVNALILLLFWHNCFLRKSAFRKQFLISGALSLTFGLFDFYFVTNLLHGIFIL